MRTEQEIKDKIAQTEHVIYLDETGAGPLCGDLFICGLVLPKDHGIVGLNDSKKLTEKKREALYDKILEKSVAHEIIRLTPEEIDTINIFQARMEGFRRAIDVLSKRINATYAVIDGNKKPQNLSIETDVLIKADAILEGVSASSIIAKVARDRYIVELASQDPYAKYGLEKHKGYGTALHLAMLKEHGPITGFHRFSYQPVRESVKINMNPKI